MRRGFRRRSKPPDSTSCFRLARKFREGLTRDRNHRLVVLSPMCHRHSERIGVCELREARICRTSRSRDTAGRAAQGRFLVHIRRARMSDGEHGDPGRKRRSRASAVTRSDCRTDTVRVILFAAPATRAKRYIRGTQTGLALRTSGCCFSHSARSCCCFFARSRAS